jgi:hypothetical protein
MPDLALYQYSDAFDSTSSTDARGTIRARRFDFPFG